MTGTTSAHRAAKATVGEAVPVVALLVKDGHDQLGAAIHWTVGDLAPIGPRNPWVGFRT